MKQVKDVKRFLIVLFLGLVLFGGMLSATAPTIRVTLLDATVHNFNYNGFDIGWNSDYYYDLWNCDNQRFSMDYLTYIDFGYGPYDSCGINSDPVWTNEMSSIDDTFISIIGRYDVRTPYVAGTLLGTTTQMSIAYSDIAFIEFFRSACSYNWQLPSYSGYLCDIISNGIPSNGTQFVGVGYPGLIATSNDGLSWTTRTSNTTQYLKAVTRYNSNFVTVGYYGVVLTSTNGIDWVSRTSGTTENLRGVASSANLYVAVGDNGKIITSPNGITWTQRTSGVTERLYDVNYAERRGFTVCGYNGCILDSGDGITWTQRSTGTTSPLLSITYSSNHNLYVAVGSFGTVATSYDGISWSIQTIPVSGALNSVTLGVKGPNFVFLAAGNSGAMASSTDGINWTVETPVTTKHIFGLTYGANKTIGVGNTLLQFTECN